MKKIDLLLTRHGETIENQRHVLQGQLPGTLSPLGKEQAVVLAEQLKQEPLDVIVCSDLHVVTIRQRSLPVTMENSLSRLLYCGRWTGEYIPAKRWRM